MRPNRDTGKMRLADVLRLSSQFLDGSLEAMFIERKRSSSPSEGGWTVDVDMIFDCMNSLQIPSYYGPVQFADFTKAA